MLLDGIQIQNYRSFDKNGVNLENFGKVNLFIGKNNSGKSNILRFINKLSTFFDSYKVDQLDCYNLDPTNIPIFSIYHNRLSLENFLSSETLKMIYGNADISVFKYVHSFSQYSLSFEDNKWLKNIFPDKQRFNDYKSQPLFRDNYPEDLISVVSNTISDIYDANCMIGNFRRIERYKNNIDKTSGTYLSEIYNGFDLIERLDALKNAKSTNKIEKSKYSKIVHFIRMVLNIDDLDINISHDDGYGKELSLEIHGIQMPLENLGTGIHQLIILAATVTVFENFIICIEEPENFLNPELQKKFIKHLLETNNQYFISTHSNSFLNVDGVEIYHITHDGVKSSSRKVISSTDKNSILDDLGFQASDLLQTNYLLWVEGPSDRIYLKSWIGEKVPNLIEGIHYSIMFYGGRLLSHLAADEQAYKDFINLTKINRNSGIIIDCDKEVHDDDINDTKRRIIDEFNKNNFYCWLTKGKEIENYISETNYRVALDKLLKAKRYELDFSQFNTITKVKINGKEKELDKIKLAKIISLKPADWNSMDLEVKVNELVKKIKSVNNLG